MFVGVFFVLPNIDILYYVPFPKLSLTYIEMAKKRKKEANPLMQKPQMYRSYNREHFLTALVRICVVQIHRQSSEIFKWKNVLYIPTHAFFYIVTDNS